jgi:hypothetical protein
MKRARRWVYYVYVTPSNPAASSENIAILASNKSEAITNARKACPKQEILNVIRGGPYRP